MNQPQFEQHSHTARDRAYGAALAVCHDTELAADVSQDVMLKLWTIHADLPTAEDLLRLAPFIARRLALNAMRHSQTVSLDSAPPSFLPSAVSPAEELEHKERLAWLEQRLQELPPSEHQIIRLQQIEGRSNEEIAALLGITRQSVATMLSRARRRLLLQFQKQS